MADKSTCNESSLYYIVVLSWPFICKNALSEITLIFVLLSDRYVIERNTKLYELCMYFSYLNDFLPVMWSS